MHSEVFENVHKMSVQNLLIQKKRNNFKSNRMIAGLKALVLVFFSSSVFADDIQVSKSCTEKNKAFEISELKFAFDLRHVSKINVLNGQAAASIVSFKNNWLPDLSIITTSEDNVSGGLNENGGYQKLGVTDVNSFFNKLKSHKSKDAYILKVKVALGVDDEKNIEIINSKNYNIYILNNNINNKDTIYIVRKNDKRIMMLVSDLQDKGLTKLLENICL
jgi:hypothetical protein